MRNEEWIKRRVKINTHPNPKDWKALNEEHVLGPARNVSVSDLRHHLIIDHGISVKSLKTPLDFGRTHYLAHALLIYPELRELMGLEGWNYKNG